MIRITPEGFVGITLPYEDLDIQKLIKLLQAARCVVDTYNTNHPDLHRDATAQLHSALEALTNV